MSTWCTVWKITIVNCWNSGFLTLLYTKKIFFYFSNHFFIFFNHKLNFSKSFASSVLQLHSLDVVILWTEYVVLLYFSLFLLNISSLLMFLYNCTTSIFCWICLLLAQMLNVEWKGNIAIISRRWCHFVAFFWFTLCKSSYLSFEYIFRCKNVLFWTLSFFALVFFLHGWRRLQNG